MTIPLPKLSHIEQETIISWNAKEKTANIYTCDPVVIRRLTKRLPGTDLIRVGLGIAVTIPKSWVKIPGKPRQRTLSEGHLKALQAGRKKAQSYPDYLEDTPPTQTSP